MKCYRLTGPFSEKRAIKFRLSPTKGEPPKGWSDALWFQKVRHIETGEFDAATVQLFKDNWVIVNPTVKELPDVIGEFGWWEGHFPALNQTLKGEIEAKAPELCSFVPTGPIYDLRHDRVIEEPKYFITAVRQRKDSIDFENGEVRTRSIGGGMTKPHLLPKSLIKRSALSGAMLWRDTRSDDVLCNSDFKDLAERVGCVGMNFISLKVSDT